MIYIVNVNELDSLRLGYDGRVRNLQKILNKNNIKNLAITNNVGHIEKISHKNFNYQGYKVITSIQYKKNISFIRFLSNIIFSVRLYIFLAPKLKNNDLIIVNSIPPEVLYFVSLLKKVKKDNFKIYLDVRDLWPYAYRSHKKTIFIKIWSYFCNFCMRRGLKNVSQSIVVSKQYINVLRELGYDGDFINLPLGFDKDRWQINKPCKNKDLTGFFIGNENNQIDLNATLKNLDGFFKKIIIVGRHDAKISLNHTQTIYEGVRNPAEVNEIVINCHYGIMPSFENSGVGLPNKLFDYIGASLPILAFGSGEASEFINDNKIGLVFSKKLASHDALREYSLLRNNLIKIRDSYSTDYLFNTYKELILR